MDNQFFLRKDDFLKKRNLKKKTLSSALTDVPPNMEVFEKSCKK